MKRELAGRRELVFQNVDSRLLVDRTSHLTQGAGVEFLTPLTTAHPPSSSCDKSSNHSPYASRTVGTCVARTPDTHTLPEPFFAYRAKRGASCVTGPIRMLATTQSTVPSQSAGESSST